MAIGSTSGVASATSHPRVRLVSQAPLPPAPAREVRMPPVQRPADWMQDWMLDLPEATRANAEVLTIWPELDLEDHEMV